MITTVAEHLVDLDILRSPANILDLGCRNFTFCNYFDQRGDFVVPVDIDFLKSDRPYLQYAVTNYNGLAGISKSSDPQATKMSRILLNGISVNAITLERLSEELKVPYWDLCKMDVEMAEKEIIHSLTKAPAKQYSIEFHMHLGQTQIEVDAMVVHLQSLGYSIASHEKTNQHGAGLNFWSSLFIIK